MRNVLIFKGYKATIKFSSENMVFIGKVTNIPDLVTFEATSVKKLAKAFKEAIKDYEITKKLTN